MNVKIDKYLDVAGILFIVSVGVLAVTSILSVWEILGHEVVEKSAKTLGLLAFAAIIIVAAGRFATAYVKNEYPTPDQPHPVFSTIRRITIGVLIISIVMLALLGVLSIWEVIFDTETLFRSLSSIGIVSFCSFIIIIMCLEREGRIFREENKKHFSLATIILIIIIMIIAFSLGWK